MNLQTAREYVKRNGVKSGETLKLFYYNGTSEIIVYRGFGPRFLDVEIQGEDGKDIEGRFISSIERMRRAKVPAQAF
jgi:hypothetical protein